jgi:formylglycine-generating enzyme required for sulfatase activity/WD40 repeat protein/energy-coupling factor transporter ATP-binding protein EcfA2
MDPETQPPASDPPRFNPFPGLRPFRSDENHLFFGREDQSAALLQLLRQNRFLAVVGTSGSGKSSLVRAGLIPELHGGTMAQAGSAWEVIVLRPGGSPFMNLAQALVDADLYDADDADTLPRLRATLSRSRYGLVEAVKQSDVVEPGGNILIVVDQFEELFRFRQQGLESEEAATAFVNLLLTACAQGERQVYVTITMRSDYLGDCSEIPGLAEAVNDGEYLIPRLQRDQKQDAIVKPIGVGGARIDPLLVQRLLNEVGDDPDQLPVLQHALMRMWDAWSAAGDRTRPIGPDDFEATGGLANALSQHADEIYAALPDDAHRAACEKLFQVLTEKGADNRGIRRPARLERLEEIAGKDRATVTAVLDAYRQPGVTFLMPGLNQPLDERSVVDLSHESLMRGWQRLRVWVDDEAQSARIFRRLSDTGQLWQDGKAGLYHDPDLQIAQSWREEADPNAAWAELYGGGFETAMGFLEKSHEVAEAAEVEREAARQRELKQAKELAEEQSLRAEEQSLRAEEQKRAAGRLKVLLAGITVIMLGMAALAVWAVKQSQRAEAATEEAQFNEGLGWLLRAEVAEERQQRYPETLLYAAKAIGFEGVGRPGGAAEPLRYIREERNPAAFEKARQWIADRPAFRPIWATALRDSPAGGLGVSATGRWLALASEDGRVAVWDMVSGSETEVLAAGSPSGAVADIAFHPLENRLAIALKGSVQVWDLETKALLEEHPAGAGALAWSPGGELLAAAAPDEPVDPDSVVRPLIAVGDEWDYFKGTAAPSSPADAWKELAFEVDAGTWGRGPSGFGYADDDDATVLDDMEGQYTSVFIRKELTVAIAPGDGDLELVIDYDDGYVAWLNGVEVARSDNLPAGDVDFQTTPRSGEDHKAGTPEVIRLGLASDLLNVGSNVLAIAGFNAAPRGFFGIMMEDGAEGVRLSGVVPGGAAAGAGLEVGDQILEVDDVKVTSSAHLATLLGSKRPGNRVAIKYRRGDEEEKKRVETELGVAPDSSDFSLIPSLRIAPSAPDNRGSVRLWGGEAPVTLASGLQTPAARLSFSPENSIIAAAFPGQGVRVFLPQARAAAELWAEAEVGEASSVAVSPDGARLAIGGADGSVSLWDAATAERLGLVPAELRHGDKVLDLAFRADGRQLASASADGTVKLWDVSGADPIPKNVATLCGHVGAVSRIRYAPGGDLLASAGADGSARLWWVGEEPDAPADLFAYLERGFFAFDPDTQATQWAGGSGFLGVPATSLAGLWQNADGAKVADYLLAGGDWSAAGKLGADAGAVSAALLADAEKAGEEKRWPRVDLRLRQLAEVGGEEGADAVGELTAARAAATASEGEPFTSSDGISMVWCPATGPDGFQMGSPPGEAGRNGDETQHTVVLSSGFWIGKYELTQGEWVAVMGPPNPSNFTDGGAKYPVENISWVEAVDFCRRLTYRERTQGTLPPGWEYALPSEAQWEYACRAGTTTAYSFGDDPAELHQYGNYNDRNGTWAGADKEHDDGHHFTAPVGSYLANAWGLHDMHGNVWEWCQDSPDAYGSVKVSDPLGTRGPDRVNRGGGFNDAAGYCRSANRNAYQPANRSGILGFRPAVVPSRTVQP